MQSGEASTLMHWGHDATSQTEDMGGVSIGSEVGMFPFDHCLRDKAAREPRSKSPLPRALLCQRRCGVYGQALEEAAWGLSEMRALF